MTTRASSTSSPNEFFQAGGTLTLNFRSYVTRPSDDELCKAARAGDFCYVLTTRQMGKSSMMVRTAQRLQEDDIQTAIIDLTKIGADATAEQWYLGLLTYLIRELKLEDALNVESWWRENEALSPVQRFTHFLHDVILARVKRQLAIFIDEIDTTLRLNFSDDFFAAIRAMYNARATEPAYERLTFILIGVATPTDLMKDSRRTPFNIGHRIDLLPFRLTDKKDLASLVQGLNAFYPEEGELILERIFYWADGHPYLTHKLCLTIVEKKVAKNNRWTVEEIDKIVEKEFLSETGRGDENFQFANVKILSHEQKDELLALYRHVYQGEKIADNKRSLLHGQLKLSGLVRADEGYLRVSNRIYRHIFDLKWIKENTKTRPTPTKIVTVASVIILLAILGLWGLRGILNVNNQTPAASITPMVAALVPEGEQTPTTAAAIPTDPSLPIDTPGPMLTDMPTLTPTPMDFFPPTPTNTPTITPTATAKPIITARTSESTNILPAPSDNFDPIATIAAGEEVEVIGISTNGEWLFVKNREGASGFVTLSDLVLTANITLLEEVPTPRLAVALAPVSILPEPISDPGIINEIQLDTIRRGEMVDVIGRLDRPLGWLYISNGEGAEGFAALNRLDWPGTAAEFALLPTRQP